MTDELQNNVPLITRRILWFLLFSLVANASLSLLFSVLPLFASESTGSSLAAGLATGTMMLVTVLVELGTPRLMAALGYRRVMVAGVALLGFPSLLLIGIANMATILAVSAARGAGLAITVVAGTALAAQLFPVHRRAEGLGIYGVALSIPVIVLLPLGLWLAESYSFDLVFTIAAIAAIAGIAIVQMLPALDPGKRPTHSIMAELADPVIARPAVIFALSTFGAGIVLTYLALAVPGETRYVAPAGLFVQAICTSVARWGAGRLGDRFGSRRLLAPSMLVAAIGMACIVATGSTTAVLAGMALFGLGLGGAQNASLAIMFERADKDRFAQVSVIWNLAYDAGLGIGAVGFGLLIGQTGYPWGFAIVAMILLASVVPAWLGRRHDVGAAPLIQSG
jgi:MFS family permease